MASKNNINSVFTDIANSIRAKKGTTNTIQPINMSEEIDGIITGIIPSGKIEITNTEEINVTNYATAQIVDSNLTEENIKEGVSILGKVGTYKGGSSEDYLEQALTNTITSYNNSNITKIKSYAFYTCENLIEVNFPNVVSINESAFSVCKNLQNVNIPKVESISNSTFSSCENLISINLPNIKKIGSSAFYGCKNLQNVNIPKVESIGNSTFQSCSKLQSIDCSLITKLEANTFQYCDALSNINLPKVTSIGSYAFQRAQKLPNIDLPLVMNIDYYAMCLCYILERVYIPLINNIGAGAFDSCYLLKKLIITQTDSVCTLKNTNAFEKCYHFLGTVNSTYNPQGLKDGRIYVPDELVNSYKSATNWSTYADIIVPLSTLVE